MSVADQDRTVLDTNSPAALLERFLATRKMSEHLCSSLNAEDMILQSMPDASPAKWHLAHTTWFFETFLLSQNQPAVESSLSSYRPFHPKYNYFFNSYYNAVGSRHPRPSRGLLSRPTAEEVYEYRSHVDLAVSQLLENANDLPRQATDIIELGIQHEQQHQELLLTDIKHAFSMNPVEPTYLTNQLEFNSNPDDFTWLDFSGGLIRIGFEGLGFSFDNELPVHRVFLEPFQLASRPVTCVEYIKFISDGGYENPAFWLSEGWDLLKSENWTAPLYWYRESGEWIYFTLGGVKAVDLGSPVCHVSFYEADAYARWAGARLPTEQEWEHAAQDLDMHQGNFQECAVFHPRDCETSLDSHFGTPNGNQLRQMFGDVWEWTSSSYAAYPGYQPQPGALGEYNGKFMCNQYVLRGGSCVTPKSHIRRTYRNFFHASKRWQFSGLRLAKSV